MSRAFHTSIDKWMEMPLFEWAQWMADADELSKEVANHGTKGS